MADPRRPAPTLESVAAQAGASGATAGRVLQGSTNVGEGAREAVHRAAEELGYGDHPLPHALAAAGRRRSAAPST